MRHKKRKGQLNRRTPLRKATLQHMVIGLLKHERICVTVPRAKEARRLAETMITIGKKSDSLAARREALTILQDRTLVKHLFTDLAPRFTECAGGYTRITKLADPRKGDGAPMAYLEWTVLAPEKTQAAASKKAAVKKAKDAEVVEAEIKPAKKKTVKKNVSTTTEASVEETPEPPVTDVPKTTTKAKKKNASEVDDESFFGGLRSIIKKKKKTL